MTLEKDLPSLRLLRGYKTLELGAPHKKSLTRFILMITRYHNFIMKLAAYQIHIKCGPRIDSDFA